MKKLDLLILLVVMLVSTSCKDDEKTRLKLDVDKPALTFSKEGAAQSVVIASNQKWEITIRDDQWLTASVLSGEGTATVIFTADPSDLVEARTNLITIKSAASIVEIPVTQSAADPRCDSDKTNLAYDYKGGTEELQISANTAWELIIDPQDDWLSADVLSGTGDAKVVLNIPTYYGKADRHAVIVLKYGENQTSIEVSQRFPTPLGVWILSEGSATAPTANLAWYDAKTGQVTPKFYSKLNGETLGQVANDMVLYGSKLYVAVSGAPDANSSSVKVINPLDGRLIKTIPMRGPHGEGDVARQIAVHKGKVYVTSYFGGGKGEPGSGYLYYGGVVRIDTVSLSIEASMRVGDKPEGIACYQDKLFVCNNETGNGKTLSVVDIETFREERTIPVPENPTYIQTAPNGDIYFSTLEIWTGPNKGPSAFHKLNPETYAVHTYTGARASRFAITDNYIFTGEFSWSTYEDVANRIDRQTGDVSRINLAHPYFMIYSVDANPATGEIYLGGSGANMIIMNSQGEKLKTLEVGTEFVNKFVSVFE